MAIREEATMTLPEELAERILARVPFPYIFKARVLSKSWLGRLSPISSQDDDDEKKRLAISFQKQVREVSTKWEAFSLVLVEKVQMQLMGYNRAGRWLRTPSDLSFLLSMYPTGYRRTYMQVEGALLLLCTPPLDLYVANVLARTWKHLPHCPGTVDHKTGPPACLVSQASLGTYKVIKFQGDPSGICLALIYDSKLGAWSRKTVHLSGYARVFRRPASLNGVTYWRVGASRMTRGLLAFNFEEDAFKILQMPHNGMPTWGSIPDCVQLMVCNGSLVLVVRANQFSVVKIDLESRRCLEVTRGPPPAALQNFGTLIGIANDGDCIFFVGRTDQIYKVLAYIVSKNEWSQLLLPAPLTEFFNNTTVCFSWYPTFQPGLNPFVAV